MAIQQDVPCIAASGLTRRFGSTRALDDLTFSVAGGQIIGLLGRNGAGKSTLLRILSGQLRQNEGELKLFGMPVFDSAAALGELCLIGDTPDFGALRNAQTFLGVMKTLFAGWDEPEALRLAERFELPMTKPLKGFSRGMQTALLLCAGLASGARLTVFDEPSLGLDAVMRERFYDMLMDAHKKQPERAFVLSTHLIDEVARTLDYAVLIDHGRLLCDGRIAELTDHYVSVSGAPDDVRAATEGCEVLREEELAGSLARYVRVRDEREKARVTSREGVNSAPVGLQRLFVFLTDEREGENRADNA